MPAYLKHPTDDTKNINLSNEVIRIGRDPQCNEVLLPIDDREVSREHARLFYSRGRWYLEDFSRNGTLVGSKKVINTQVMLKSGKRIRIGKAFDYVFYDPHITDLPLDDGSTTVLPDPSLAVKSRLFIDDSHHIWRDGELLNIHFSAVESKLFLYLYRNSNRLCPYAELMKTIWGYEMEMQNVHELAKRVRKKIELDPSRPRFLITRSGIGLILLVNPSEENHN